ncbi:hypothetical protein PABG_05385 [Paracoccidioides brasiliensis Pb03]|nr:hypothetical protein PABG_05385 [Paracoccidioides brasiliensis Pb03]
MAVSLAVTINKLQNTSEEIAEKIDNSNFSSMRDVN